MRLANIIVCLTAVGLVCGYGLHRTATAKTAEKTPLSLARLATTDTITMDIVSQGCFHQTRHQLEYAPVPTPRVTLHTDDGRGMHKSNEPLRRVGVVTLTPAQVARLDNLLRYYRAVKGGGCTTTEAVTVTTFHAGKSTGTENYTDSSCGINYLEDSDPRDVAALPKPYRRSADPRPVLSLQTAFEVAEQSGKRNAPLPYRDTPREQTLAYRLSQDYIQREAVNKQAGAMLRALPGFAAMTRSFTLSEAGRSYHAGQGDAFSAKLTPRNGGVLDMIYVYLPKRNKKPAGDWNMVLNTINRAESRAKAIPWITVWKAENAGREVTVTISSESALSEEKPEYYVYPAWQHAGLTGLPTYQMLLRWDRYSSATVFIGDADDRALLTDTNSRKKDNDGWFSEAIIHYHPTQTVPEYYVIKPDGSRTRNTRTDTETPQWFAKEKSRPPP